MSPEVYNPAPRRLPAWLVISCTAGIIVGAIGLIVQFALSPRDGWMWLVVNFVLYWGAASGIFVWAATFRVAQATWTSVISRFAQSAYAFTPALALLLIALLAGLHSYVPWVEHPIRAKQAWLNPTSFVIREIIAALLFWIPGWLLVHRSLALDRRQEIDERDHHRLNSVALIVVIAYVITATIIAWDFVMSLSPMWVSTMFSVYYLSTNAQMGLAALTLMAAGLRKPLALEGRLKPTHFHDLGNLVLAFSLFNMGLFYAQYLTIWYGNLPDEVDFLILRYDKGTWPPFCWASFIIGYAIPFLLLQSRAIKLRPGLLCIVAAMSEIGIAMERYAFVAPSFSSDLTVPFWGALSLLGFFGLLLLVRMKFLAVYPSVSRADEVLTK